MSSYESFLEKKLITTMPSGFNCSVDELHPNLYHYQKDLVRWGLARGKAALFTSTGTGKTAMETCWADSVCQYDGRPVLMVAPLAVSKQTVKDMGEKFNFDIRLCRHGSDVGPGLNITNYEMLHHFSPDQLAGIVYDESSIAKSFSSKTRSQMIEFSKDIPFRLPASATPSPNSYMELGNHAELLGIMSYSEMIATFFVHDGGDTSKWRLKGHAEQSFWKWLASWGAFLNKPSDLGYSDVGFELPTLNTYQHIVDSGAQEGALFAFEARGLQERRGARRESLQKRVDKAVEIVNQGQRPFFLWCDLNDESKALKEALPDFTEVTGSDSDDHKEKSMLAFAAGDLPGMISKSSICGWGMNFQCCGDTAYVGMSDSFESIWQSTKRFHRYPRKEPVNRHLIYSEAEGAVYQNVMRKESEFQSMVEEMVKHTKVMMNENVKSLCSEKLSYNADTHINIPKWITEGGI